MDPVKKMEQKKEHMEKISLQKIEDKKKQFESAKQKYEYWALSLHQQRDFHHFVQQSPESSSSYYTYSLG